MWLDGRVIVRAGELFVCDESCAAAGAVDLAEEHRPDESGTRVVTVVPHARPAFVETWEISGGEVRVIGREPRSALDRRRDPFERAQLAGAPQRTWAARPAPEIDALVAGARVRLGRVSVRSVRTPVGVAGIVWERPEAGYDASAVAFLRRGGELFRSCRAHEMVGGSVVLEDALEARPLGEELGAVFLRVRVARQGYEYDMGHVTELWSLVPVAGGALALSYAVVGSWHGAVDAGTGEERWTGWVAPLRTLGPRTLRLGSPERWTIDAGRPARTPAPPGEAHVLELDDLGFRAPAN